MKIQKERELLAESLDRHVEDEDEGLREYRELAEKLGNGAVGFLIDLILTEEEQHHFLLRAMAKNLREPLPGEQPGVRPAEEAQEKLLGRTQRLREHERHAMEDFRNLKAQLTLEDSEFLSALLDVIILDSEKHHRLLLAIEKMIQAGTGRL